MTGLESSVLLRDSRGEKTNQSATHVELSGDGLRTRVRFPPAPPFKAPQGATKDQRRQVNQPLSAFFHAHRATNGRLKCPKLVAYLGACRQVGAHRQAMCPQPSRRSSGDAPMLTNKLSDIKIRKATHADKAVKLADGGGLYWT